MTKHHHVSRRRFHPWYASPASGYRWGVRNLVAWITGKSEAPVGSEKFIPEGYLLSEVGPEAEVERGLDDMKNTVDLLASKTPQRRPFAPDYHNN